LATRLRPYEFTKNNPQKRGTDHSNEDWNCQQSLGANLWYRKIEMAMNEDPVVVFTAQGELEETQVRSFLKAHGIPTVTHGEALRKTHGLTLDGLGQVEIIVAAEHAAEALQLLADAERGELRLDD
jgi:hypothetical protein